MGLILIRIIYNIKDKLFFILLKTKKNTLGLKATTPRNSATNYNSTYNTTLLTPINKQY